MSKPKYEVYLASCGNPDYGQDPDASLYGAEVNHWFGVESFAEASKVCREFIERNDLGGGNWAGGEVRDMKTGKKVARVSYNGRVWDNEGKEIAI